MTKYLKNPGAGWDNPGSTPVEDIREVIKRMKKDTSIPVDSLRERTEEELHEIAEKHHARTGFWPSHLIYPDGRGQKIPPRASPRSP